MPPTQVSTGVIADNAVTPAKLATDAVETVKIKDANVTQAKLASGVATTGPAFSAYNGGTQSISATTNTKVTLSSEDYDTANCFDSSSNYRFTPNVAGYYYISAAAYFQGTGIVVLNLYKNGSIFRELGRDNGGAATLGGSTLVYLNGTTDYIELYCYSQNSNTLGSSAAAYLWMNGHLARAA